MPSIHDVAKRVGVSVTTVSRVLNNRGYIGEKTRQKVMQAMEELNYRPNELARSLFRKKSNLIGLIVPDMAFSFFAEFCSEIEKLVYEKGYKLMICNARDDGAREREYIKLLRSSQVDGIILASHTLDIEEFNRIGLPLVTLDRIVPGAPCVSSDHYAGGQAAVRALLERGSRNLLHVRGPSRLETPAHLRSEAFLHEVQKAGVRYHIEETGENEFDFDDYVQIFERLMELDPEIDGIFASNDMLGLAALRVARNRGKRVPEDLQIVGFDGVRVTRLITPQLTTVRQDIPLMASRSVQILIEQIGLANKADEPEAAVEIEVAAFNGIQQLIPVTFIEGETIRPL